MKYLLFIYCLVLFVSCNDSKQEHVFHKIQDEMLDDLVLDKSTFNISGKVKYLFYPLSNYEKGYIELHGEEGLESHDCLNLSRLDSLNTVNDFDYFEFNILGKVTKYIQKSCVDGEVEEYSFEEDKIVEEYKYRIGRDDLQKTQFKYNSEGLVSEISRFYNDGKSLNEIEKTKITYTDDFAFYERIYHNKTKIDTSLGKRDKAKNSIEIHPMVKYEYNRDSLVSQIKYLDNISYEKKIFYDNMGNKIREVEYDSLIPKEIVTNKYDSNNKLIHSVVQDSASQTITFFDKNNDIVNRYKFDAQSGIGSHYSHWEQYDEMNNLVLRSIISKSESGNLKEELFTYNYEFDFMKNWISKKTFRQDSLINETSRVIEYYEE